MELVYTSDKQETQCTNMGAAKKLFSGDETMAVSLLARINALKNAETIKDITVQRQYRFHKLINKKRRKLEGYFAIDVKSQKDLWRIILQPLDAEKKPYEPCDIDKIAGSVKIIKIVEVSKHYV